MSDATISGIELRQIEANIDRSLAETRKFVSEREKLMAEREKLSAEAQKLDRDRRLAPLLLAATFMGGVLAAGVGLLAHHFGG